MVPAQRGSSLALFAATLFVGQAAGVAIGGALVERIGTAPVIAGAAALLVVVGLAFAAARKAKLRA
jgi:predicted MFS family arabinose efflux permease